MGCERMDGMTPEELLAWANGLGICEFRSCKDAASGEIVCERGNARISLEFGRYAMREKEGARFVAVNARVGMSGRSRPCDTLEEARHMLDVWADWAGLRSEAMQLTMF